MWSLQKTICRTQPKGESLEERVILAIVFPRSSARSNIHTTKAHCTALTTVVSNCAYVTL